MRWEQLICNPQATQQKRCKIVVIVMQYVREAVCLADRVIPCYAASRLHFESNSESICLGQTFLKRNPALMTPPNELIPNCFYGFAQ